MILPPDSRVPSESFPKILIVAIDNDKESEAEAITVGNDGDGVDDGIDCHHGHCDHGDLDQHDQLPEARRSHAFDTASFESILLFHRHRTKFLVAVAVGAALVVVLELLGVAIAYNTKSKSNARDSRGGCFGIHNNNNNNNDDDEPKHRYQKICQLLFEDSRVSPLQALGDKQSAEHLAVLFLAEGDTYFQSVLDTTNTNLRQKLLERYVLTLLYYKTTGRNWTHHYNFLGETDHCHWNEAGTSLAVWKGVWCDGDGFVVGIDLSDNHLVGVGNNAIPSELVQLSGLETLLLHRNNNLKSSVPDLTPLRLLTSIGWMDTGLEGTIPECLGAMTQLTALTLGNNDFKDSTIPDSYRNLVSLRILGLESTGISGSIDAIKGLHHLEALYLEDNQLTGHLGGNDWSHARELDLSNNLLDGRIPRNLLHNPSLTVLDLHQNLFTGDVPTNLLLFPSSSLEYISLGSNSLGGTLSDGIGFLTSLQHLDVQSNALIGTLPDALRLLTNLVSLSTSGNEFSSQPLAEFFTALSGLTNLSMRGNNLVGTLPDGVGSMVRLRSLDLGFNNLSGELSSEFGLLTTLRSLVLHRNELTGTIPSQLARLTNLHTLLLEGNNLRGNTHPICASRRFASGISSFVSDCYQKTTIRDNILANKNHGNRNIAGNNHDDDDDDDDDRTNGRAEVECRCCTLCCKDENPSCNSNDKSGYRDWADDFDSRRNYGYT